MITLEVLDMPKGEQKRKITQEQTKYIQLQAAKGICLSALARKFHISRQRVWQIKEAV